MYVSVALAGDYAYVTRNGSAAGLSVFDLSVPDRPRLTGIQHASLAFSQVAVQGNRLYALDLANPLQPRRVGSATRFSAWAVAPAARCVCLSLGADGLRLFEPYRPPPELALHADTNGVRLILRARAEQSVMLERSQDLPQWTDWRSTVATGAAQVFLDPQAGPPTARYYRARLVPADER